MKATALALAALAMLGLGAGIVYHADRANGVQAPANGVHH